MNFLFIHISPLDIGLKKHTQWVSQKIPHYAFLQMEKTYSVHNGNCNIHFVCNPTEINDYDKTYIEKYGINIIDYSKIQDSTIENIVNLGSYCFDLDLVCLLKFPIMSNVMKTYGLNEMLYQENDVAIFMDFNDVRNYFNGVTVCGKTIDNALLTGIFYCNNIQILNKISEFTIQCLKNRYNISDYSMINMFQEIYGELNILPSIPSDTEENILFDPASFGQYMAGNNQNNRTSFMDPQHRIVMNFLNDNRILIYKDNNVYKFDYNGKTYKFFNIHIHNKLAIERLIK